MSNKSTITKTKKAEVSKAQEQGLPGLDALGFGYDIRGQYANPVSIKLPIIDFGKGIKTINVLGKYYTVPSEVTIDVHPMNRSSYQVIYGKEINQYKQNLNSYTKISGSYFFFSGSLEVDFNSSELRNTENAFSIVRNVIDLWTLNLPDPRTLNILDSARKDINGDTGLNAKQLFEKYGTHYIWQGIVGGRLDYSAATSKKTFNQSYSLSVAAEMSYQNLVGSISASNKTKFSKEISEFNSSSKKNINSVGGNPAFAAKIANQGQSAFAEWADSVNREPILIDFTENSLIPIWSLCADTKRREELENGYKGYMSPYKIPTDSNPRVEISFTNNLIQAGSDQDSGADDDLTVYKPAPQTGYYWLGQYAQGNYNNPTGQLALVKPLTPKSVAIPIGFERIWDDGGSGDSHDYSCWRPIPPEGYVSLGYIMRLRAENQNPPSGAEIDGLVCVHESLVEEAIADDKCIWSDAGTWADEDCSIYKITPKFGSSGVDAGTFYGQRKSSEHQPNPTKPQVYCLKKQ